MKAYESDFISLEFVSKRDGGQATIRWLKPTSVVTRVILPGTGPERPIERNWDGLPEDTQRVQASIAGLRNKKLGRNDDYELQVISRGQKFATLVWDGDQETEELSDLRRMLERIGHLKFVEALAYLERGRAFVERGELASAIKSLRTGIQILGDLYVSPATEDDTGMKLVLAEHKEENGELDTALSLFERVLESRISEYLRLHKLDR